MKNQPEFQLQKSICKYLDLQYPNVLYLSDTVASVKLTIPQQVRNKSIQKVGFKCPDLLILEPRGKYAGLFIELKTKSPFKKTGGLLKNSHIEEQLKTLEDLNSKGYKACFSWDFEQCKSIIQEYFSQRR